MKLYKTHAPEAGVRARWSGSQAAAASDRKHFNSKMGIPRDNIATDEVEVPTNKKGLLAFLNGADAT